ncbi:hypothetical protein [Massilia putida]|uniref:hypothetical protein n=1 Tax=Massilia putida TaxID=1141883 RepID=UPI001E31B009|nr:hypothetical protein [Massilia putida]
MSLQDAVEVLTRLGSGQELPGRSQIIAAALAAETVTLDMPGRDIQDAAAGLKTLAVGQRLFLDEAGRARALHLANVLAAYDWRKERGYVGRGGVVVFYAGKINSWVNELRNPDHWVAGAVAVNEAGNSWLAIGGDEQNGATAWKPQWVDGRIAEVVSTS